MPLCKHIILAKVMIILLHYDLYNSILYLDQPNEGVICISGRVVWTIYMLLSNLTITLALFLLLQETGIT
jgi:hypothetical protein